MNISWKMLGLAREYRLFNGKQIIGILRNDFWNRKAYGELRGSFGRFEHEGLGKKQARILDIEGENLLGSIDFKSSPRTATITYEGETFTWQAESGGSWKVGNDEDMVHYSGKDSSGSEGTITDAYLPPIVLLAGLYVKGFFFKRKVLGFAMGFLIGILIVYLVT